MTQKPCTTVTREPRGHSLLKTRRCSWTSVHMAGQFQYKHTHTVLPTYSHSLSIFWHNLIPLLISCIFLITFISSLLALICAVLGLLLFLSKSSLQDYISSYGIMISRQCIWMWYGYGNIHPVPPAPLAVAHHIIYDLVILFPYWTIWPWKEL